MVKCCCGEVSWWECRGGRSVVVKCCGGSVVEKCCVKECCREVLW